MNLNFTEQATEDLEAIKAYLTPRSPMGAANVQRAISRALSVIVQFPNSGRTQTIEPVRLAVVTGYPYAIYYRIDDEAETIWILAVQHTARHRPFENS
jgi:toxin ParE1/3/4